VKANTIVFQTLGFFISSGRIRRLSQTFGGAGSVRQRRPTTFGRERSPYNALCFRHSKRLLTTPSQIIRIPKELGVESDEALAKVFNELDLAHPTTSIRVSRDVKDLPDLIKAHDEHVESLEQCLTRYLRGSKLASKRPQLRLDGWKILPVGGIKVDAISYYTEEIERYGALIKERRDSLDKEAPTNYGMSKGQEKPEATTV
jgi:hypothetical protein